MNPDNTVAELEALFPDTGESTVPTFRLGKTPPSAQQAQTFPCGASAEENNAFRLSWVDEEDLGVRVFVTAERGPQGTEIVASAESVRPDHGWCVSVALWPEGPRRETLRLTIDLDQPSADGRGWCGRRSFGPVEDLRQHLGDRVVLDVFLVGPPETTPKNGDANHIAPAPEVPNG